VVKGKDRKGSREHVEKITLRRKEGRETRVERSINHPGTGELRKTGNDAVPSWGRANVSMGRTFAGRKYDFEGGKVSRDDGDGETKYGRPRTESIKVEKEKQC